MKMKPAELLLLLLGGSCFLRAGSCRRSPVVDAECVSSYQDSISCSLNISEAPADPAALQLLFTDTERINYSCPLQPTNQGFSCHCRVKMDHDFLVTEDVYSIELCSPSGCQTVMDEFRPSDNIQLTPPSHVDVRSSADTLTVTWTSGYQNHIFLDRHLQYQLLLYDITAGAAPASCPGQPPPPPPPPPPATPYPHLGATQAHSDVSSCPRMIYPDVKSSLNSSVSLRRSALRAGATYCVTIQSSPMPSVYTATWSHWSQWACWRNPGEEGNKLVFLTGLLAPLCVAAVLLLFALHSPATRMKLKSIYQTPTPAPFFKPLFQQHDGNLQAWLSPPGKMAPAAVGEEVLTINAVIVVPKPKEENQELLPPAAAAVPLTFPQSPDCYVGVPLLAGPAPPPAEPCEVNMSYTPLPCALWGLEAAAGGSILPPPKDLLDVSRDDSGCSCDDLSQSPECSLPSSPGDAAPTMPLCFNGNYCILNKTVGGVVPVLVCKEMT